MNDRPTCQMPTCTNPRDITMHDLNAPGGKFELCLGCARRALGLMKETWNEADAYAVRVGYYGAMGSSSTWRWSKP